MASSLSQPTPTRSAPASAISWNWFLVALAAHTGWGIYPVLGRYMQTVSHLPSMSVLILGGLPMLLALFVYVLPRYGWRIYRHKVLWVFGFVVVVRSITNLLSQRFTLAIYVQLMALLTPFIVVFFNRIAFGERSPRYTGRAIVLSTLGAVMVLSQSIGAQGLAFSLTPSDWLGLGLAFASSTFLALYMLLVRRTVHLDIPGGAVLVFQTVLIQASALGISLLVGEDWGRWGTLDGMGWTVFLGYVVLVVLGANGLQISALRHLGAPLVSSLMGWRLVSTLGVGMLLLGEQLTSWWQAAGMLLVLVTITWYLWQQRSIINQS